jgi:hypothetical protein
MVHSHIEQLSSAMLLSPYRAAASLSATQVFSQHYAQPKGSLTFWQGPSNPVYTTPSSHILNILPADTSYSILFGLTISLRHKLKKKKKEEEEKKKKKGKCRVEFVCAVVIMLLCNWEICINRRMLQYAFPRCPYRWETAHTTFLVERSASRGRFSVEHS